MNTSRACSTDTGTASEFLVCSMLMRMGFEAHITMSNKKSVDLRVIKDDTTWTIDVKAVRGYSSWIVNNVVARHNHYVVLLCYNEMFEDVTKSPDVFVVPSADIASVAKSFKDQKRVFKRDVVKYHNAWDLMHKSD